MIIQDHSSRTGLFLVSWSLAMIADLWFGWPVLRMFLFYKPCPTRSRQYFLGRLWPDFFAHTACNNRFQPISLNLVGKQIGKLLYVYNLCNQYQPIMIEEQLLGDMVIRKNALQDPSWTDSAHYQKMQPMFSNALRRLSASNSALGFWSLARTLRTSKNNGMWTNHGDAGLSISSAWTTMDHFQVFFYFYFYFLTWGSETSGTAFAVDGWLL